MTKGTGIFKNVDPLDIDDVLIKIETSFNIHFNRTLFIDVTTFGQFCDIVVGQIKLGDSESCTTQQAFYKLRNAISNVVNVNKNDIRPKTSLAELLSRDNRLNIIADIESELGFKTHILQPKQWIVGALVLLLIVFIIECFFAWKIGVPGILLSIVGLKIADIFGKELRANTVGDLANKISREHYLKSRRDSATVNKKEVEQKVKELFIDYLDLNPLALTRDATFV